MIPFEVGQKVVCVNEGSWRRHASYTYVDTKGPEKGQICEVRKIRWRGRSVYLGLVGYSDHYVADQFRPLVSDHIELFQSWAVPVTTTKRTPVDA